MTSIRAGWWRWLLAALACCVTAAAAYLTPVPVRVPVEAVRPAPLDALLTETTPIPAEEKHEALLTSRRWGAVDSLPRDPVEPIVSAPSPAPTINPELQKINFVGLITVQDQRSVLLTVPNVGIERFVAGDRLPDGRMLVSVTSDSLTIKADGLPEEELFLFPSVPNDARQPAETEVHGQGSEVSR